MMSLIVKPSLATGVMMVLSKRNIKAEPIYITGGHRYGIGGLKCIATGKSFPGKVLHIR